VCVDFSHVCNTACPGPGVKPLSYIPCEKNQLAAIAWVERLIHRWKCTNTVIGRLAADRKASINIVELRILSLNLLLFQQWSLRVLRLDMPVQVVFARHSLRAPLNRTNKLRCVGGHPKFSLMCLRFLVTFQVFSGVFAVAKVYLTGLACVRFMSPQM
jgi:hypothetical protein